MESVIRGLLRRASTDLAAGKLKRLLQAYQPFIAILSDIPIANWKGSSYEFLLLLRGRVIDLTTLASELVHCLRATLFRNSYRFQTQEIEAVLNEWTAQGWTFDTLQFAMRDSSRRPSMAFATFTRPTDPDDD